VFWSPTSTELLFFGKMAPDRWKGFQISFMLDVVQIPLPKFSLSRTLYLMPVRLHHHSFAKLLPTGRIRLVFPSRVVAIPDSPMLAHSEDRPPPDKEVDVLFSTTMLSRIVVAQPLTIFDAIP